MGEHRDIRTALRRTAGAVAVAGFAALLAACSVPASPGAAPSATTEQPDLVVITPSPAPSSSSSASSSPSAATRAEAKPFITSATWDATAGRLDVTAIVPEIVEPDGVCTVTAERDGVTESTSADAAGISTYTACQSLSIAGLGAGSWSVRVTYESGTSAGASAPQTVTVG